MADSSEGSVLMWTVHLTSQQNVLGVELNLNYYYPLSRKYGPDNQGSKRQPREGGESFHMQWLIHRELAGKLYLECFDLERPCQCSRLGTNFGHGNIKHIQSFEIRSLQQWYLCHKVWSSVKAELYMFKKQFLMTFCC